MSQARDTYVAGSPLVTDEFFDKMEVRTPGTPAAALCTQAEPRGIATAQPRALRPSPSQQGHLTLRLSVALAPQARLKDLDSEVVRKWPRCSVLKRRMYSDIRVRGTWDAPFGLALARRSLLRSLIVICFRLPRLQMDSAQLSALGGVWASFLFVGGFVAFAASFTYFM